MAVATDRSSATDQPMKGPIAATSSSKLAPRLPIRPHHAALAGHALTAAAFLLPWAAGAGPLRTRNFTGPELASLLRNSDLLISNAAGGPLAFALIAAIYAVPVAAVTGLILLAGAPWTSSPQAARRAAARLGVIAFLFTLGTVLALQVGPGAGRYLRPLPGPGAFLALLGAALACLSAWPRRRP